MPFHTNLLLILWDTMFFLLGVSHLNVFLDGERMIKRTPLHLDSKVDNQYIFTAKAIHTPIGFWVN